ncbi:toxin YdaT family protein [Enterobacteriaceae bacterium ESL0689]|nr:toxin YdaT family protein [Enterobacteriaceae bacterium ESL0689]
MKITPNHQVGVITAELEAWALADGWKAVGLAITDQYHASGGGDILPPANTSDGLRNAVQRIRRIFRGYDGPKYASLARELYPVALSALPAERRARIESPGDPVLLAAVAARESTEAVNAVHLRAAPAIVLREINEAISAFVAMRAAVTPLCTDSPEIYRSNYA